MKQFSIKEVEKELGLMEPQQVLKLLMRLAKYKKENKEFVAYLLFQSDDENGFIKLVKEEIDVQFEEINKSTIYRTKKGLRKILKIANKQIKFSGSKKVEIELKLYFCLKVKLSDIKIHKSQLLINLFDREMERIKTALSTLHPDLQIDYLADLERLSE